MVWAGNIPQNRIDKRTRRLAQQLNRYDLTLGKFLVPYTGAQDNVGLGVYTLTTTGVVATGNLTVSSTLVLASGSITDSSGAIAFGNENLSTAGSLSVGTAFVANNAGGNFDSVIKGNTDDNLFYCDASTDRIGIGTATPAVKLDIRGSVNVGTSGADTDYDVNFYGVSSSQFHWDATTGTIWSGTLHTAVTGLYCFVCGTNNTVSANRNIVSGYLNSVSGIYNAVFGRENATTSNYNLIGGYKNTINSQYSFAAGRDNTVSYGAGAIGSGNTASGNYSFSVGYLNSSTGIEAMSFGLNNIAGHSVAIMIGNANSSTGNYAYCIGNGNSAGFSAVALGYYNVASGNYGVAIGKNSTSGAANSVAIGNNAAATGIGAVSIGGSIGCSGQNAVTIGGNIINAVANSVMLGVTYSLFFGTETEIRLNDDGSLIDVVIEGDTDTNLFHSDASTDRIGIGIAAPTNKLHVNGGVTLDGTSSSLYVDGSIITSSAGTIYFVSDNLLTTGLGTFGNITITAPNTTNYLFTTRGTSDTLAVQSQTTGTKCVLELFTKEGDGSDEVTFRLFAQGTPESITNFEDLDVRYDPGGPYYIIRSSAAGIGTIHPIRLNCGAYTSQVVLNSDGNVGINTATPDSQFEVNGESRFGASATNYTQFAADGELTLAGTARVINHLRFGAAVLKIGAASPTAGFTGVYPHLAFSHTVNQEAHYSEAVPSKWDNTTTVEVCIDWVYTGVQDNGTVKWDFEYRSVAAGELVDDTTTTITETSPGTHTTGQLVRTCFSTTIPAAALAYEDDLGFRLERDQANDTLGTSAKLIAIHFHFTSNKLGAST